MEQPERFAASHRAVVLRAARWLALCQILPVMMALAGVAGLLWIKGYVLVDLAMVVVGVLLTVKISRCLVVTLPDVGALRLDRGTHALLFRDINEIRQRIDAPKFSRIEFTMELNASVAQRPRWLGLLGSSSTLYIGFPLIFSLSREELKTVLAHEIAHVSRRHALSHRWIFQIHLSVVNIYEYLSGGRRGIIGVLLEKWLGGFMPSLVNHGFVAGRLHEREADLIAVTARGRENCAAALVKIAVLAAIYHEELHESLEERVRRSDFPNVRFLEELQRHVDAALKSPAHVRELLEVALQSASDLASSHPSLRERLENIGAGWVGDVDLRGGAAEEYFGREYKKLREELDRGWLTAVMPVWRSRHQGYRALEANLSRKSNLQDSGEQLHGYELIQIASWTEELYGPRHALTAYGDFHSKYPHVQEGRFHYGRLLLANNDERGLQVLRELVEAEPVYREEGLNIMRTFYHRRRNPEGSRWCDEQLESFYHDMEAVLEDRFEQRKTDMFHVHESTEAFQESLYRLCGKFPGIQSLHVLRKDVKFFTESPFFVVLVSFGRSASDEAERSKILEIIRGVIELPGDCVVIDGPRNPGVRKRLKAGAFAAAKIYDRNDG